MPVWFKSIPTTKEFSTRPFRNLRNMLSRRGLVMVLCLACVMASADDAACALQKPLGKVKIRDNYLYFYGLGQTRKVQSVQFDETSHSITAVHRRLSGLFHRIALIALSLSLLVPIWMSGQGVMDQKKWHTISMLV